MLAPLGAAATAVAFARGPKAATAARKRWGKAVSNKVIALDDDGKKAKKAAKRRGGGGGGGFAAKLAEELAPRGSGGGGASALAVPRDAEVLLVVGALGAAELAAVRAACDERGPALAVVLLNARLEAFAERGDADAALVAFCECFETAFALAPALPRAPGSAAAPETADEELVLWREFPGEWELARRRRGVGAAVPPRVLRRFGATRPSRGQITEGASEAAEDRDLLDRLGEIKLPFT